MFQNGLMAGAAGQGGFYDYQIEQSLRFNDDDSAYLSRVPGTAGNRKTWTWSGWLKLGALGTTRRLFMGSQGPTISSTGDTSFLLDANDQFIFQQDNAGTAIFKTNAVFRDPSAWYHFVAVWNSTDAAATDRFKVYVNGIRQAGTYTGTFTLNLDGAINSTNFHTIGMWQATIQPYDGYMAEVNFIDGSALDPTSFGQFKSGIWVPKAYTGSYGTNGFYLSFADSAAIGDDLSGNGNDWTPSGLASTDVMLDSPTNNYATINQTQPHASILSDGNLRMDNNNRVVPVLGSIGVSSGKWAWKVTINTQDAWGIGVSTTPRADDNSSGLGVPAYEYSYDTWDGDKRNNNTQVAYGATIASGGNVEVLLDLDAGTLSFRANGVDQGTAYTGLSGTFFPAFSNFNASTGAGKTIDVDFGQAGYTPPAGFLALNTANLPEPTITPAQDDVPADYFNTVLWTGDGTTPRSITGLGFEPSLSWYKSRSAAYFHHVFDAVRGANQQLHTNATSAETTQTQALISFDADGFTLGSNVGGNESGQTYVGWNWKAAGAGVANTDGTISSTVSANTKAGFSIVSYTGNLTAAGNSTVGHGLGVAPNMIITKSRNAVTSWIVQFPLLGQNKILSLDTTNAVGDSVASGGGTLPLPTSTTFGISWITGLGINGHDHIAYCFAEVEGYSKFGSYTGNGSADGPFVWCGFRPAWVLIKRTDSTGNWVLHDVERNTFNVVNNALYPNTSDAEVSSWSLDILSNGFKQRNTGTWVNASGGTYIFAAFAETPFKYSVGR